MIYDIPAPRVLSSSGSEVRRLAVIDATVREKLTPLSTATITLMPDDALAIRDWVEMYTTQGSAGVFRVRAPSHQYRLERKEYELDHGIAELGDYVIKDDAEYSGAASTVIPQIFAHYGGSMWRLGSVAASTSVEFHGSYENVLSALLRVMDQLPDYMLSFSQSSVPWTVSVVAKPTTVTAEGRLGRNVESCKITEDDRNLCTRLWWKGVADGETETPAPTGHIDADTLSTYGVVEQFFQRDEDKTQAQFLDECNRYLAQHKRPLLSISIELQDLQQITGESLDSIAVGQKYRLALPDYGRTEEETVVSLEWRNIYGERGRVSVELANEEYTLSRAMHSASSSASREITKTKSETQKNKYKWVVTDKHVTDQGEILHAAGLEIDAHGVWMFAKEEGALGTMQASVNTTASGVTTLVTKTGIESLGATETLYSKTAEVKVTADAVSIEVTEARGNQTRLAGNISLRARQIDLEAVQTNINNLATGVTTASTLRVTNLVVGGNGCSWFRVNANNGTFRLLGTYDE